MWKAFERRKNAIYHLVDGRYHTTYRARPATSRVASFPSFGFVILSRLTSNTNQGAVIECVDVDTYMVARLRTLVERLSVKKLINRKRPACDSKNKEVVTVSKPS